MNAAFQERRRKKVEELVFKKQQEILEKRAKEVDTQL